MIDAVGRQNSSMKVEGACSWYAESAVESTCRGCGRMKSSGRMHDISLPFTPYGGRADMKKRIIKTSYICPKCCGYIDKVVYEFPTHSWYRWTCNDCDRDYGYDTQKPLVE